MNINPKFKSLIPPLAPEELAQLEANIRADGCRDPLVTWRGVLIDGHNRYDICTRHGIKFETVEKEFADDEAAMDWMDANQLGRRNLTPDQRSILRGRRYNRTKKPQGGTGANQFKQSGQSVHSATAESLAKEHHVSEKTIRRDGKRAEALDLLAEVEPEKAQAVRDGVKKFNEVKREMKKEQLAKPVEKPTGKHRIIYADPPWSYNDKCDAGAIQSGGAEKHYPSMSIAELCALPVRELAEDDAVLFLWTTSPLLFECAPLIAAWGFKYKACFVWDKVKHNMGHYNSVRHEFLLICTRGSCTPEVVKLFDSVQSIEKTAKHSEKPQEFRDIIDTLYPHGERIELFARAKHKGWKTWGNEA
jgi:N6-adenosine-specific RNA methylase IME4